LNSSPTSWLRPAPQIPPQKQRARRRRPLPRRRPSLLPPPMSWHRTPPQPPSARSSRRRTQGDLKRPRRRCSASRRSMPMTPSPPTTTMSPSRRSSSRPSPTAPEQGRRPRRRRGRALRAHPRVHAGDLSRQQEDGLRRPAPEHEHGAVRARGQCRHWRHHADGQICHRAQLGLHCGCQGCRIPAHGADQVNHTAGSSSFLAPLCNWFVIRFLSSAGVIDLNLRWCSPVQMSQQKFASNVIEKSLAFGNPLERQLLIGEMLGTTDETEHLEVCAISYSINILMIILFTYLVTRKNFQSGKAYRSRYLTEVYCAC
jgi:hypothetical protein